MRTCRHFPLCGGCQSLDIPYVKQLERKHQTLRELFRDFPEADIANVLESPSPYDYRHKVQLPFAVLREGKHLVPSLGCYAAGSHQVVDQRECHVQDPALSRLVWAVRDWARKERIPVYDERTGQGFLRHVLLRKGFGTGEILLGLVANGEKPPGSRRLTASLLDQAARALNAVPGTGRLVGVVQSINTRSTNVVLGTREVLWWGRPFLKERLGAFTFRMGISTFFQVNPFQTPRLYDIVRDWVPDGSRLLDVYCGNGTITLWCAAKTRETLGIEANPAAIRAARQAAQDNGVRNVRFVLGDAAQLVPERAREGFDAAVVDPPRKGLDEPALKALASAGLRRLIYVSCNPESLLRDAALLRGCLALKAVRPVDMFPHTEHVECVALFEPQEA